MRSKAMARWSPRPKLLFRSVTLALALIPAMLRAGDSETVSFSRSPEVCVLEWTSTADGNEYSVAQLFGDGRFEWRHYLNVSNLVPTSQVTTYLSPVELSTWLSDIVDSRLYVYSRADIARRIEATGRVPMLVTDTGPIYVRIRYEQASAEGSVPCSKSNTFVSDVTWHQADRYPEFPEFAAVRRMWQRFSSASKSGKRHSEPLAPAPLPISSWTAEERAHAGWTRD